MFKYGQSITQNQFEELSEAMRRKGVEHQAFELLADLRISEQQAIEDRDFLKKFIPPWASEEPLSGIDPTFYGTGTFLGDLAVYERVVKILNR